MSLTTTSAECLCHRALPSGAVGDRDLCLLNTMVFESPDSSGSSCQGGIYNAEEGACIPLPPYAIRSGPRRNIYFRPEQVRGARQSARVVNSVDSTCILPKRCRTCRTFSKCYCGRAQQLSGSTDVQVTAAIVTCGGLCPGLNDVVQNIVYTLADYGVPLDQVPQL